MIPYVPLKTLQYVSILASDSRFPVMNWFLVKLLKSLNVTGSCSYGSSHIDKSSSLTPWHVPTSPEEVYNVFSEM
jgi:hypothetical protein